MSSGAQRRKAIQDWLFEMEEEATVFDGPEYDEAIVGLVENKDGYHVVYSRAKCIESLVKGGMTREDAEDFFSYNAERALPYMRSSGSEPYILWDVEEHLGFMEHG
jgi:hypothetical protein